MTTYKVKIIETCVGYAEIEANSEEEAKEKFDEYYFQHANEFLLEPEDTEFEIKGGD